MERIYKEKAIRIHAYQCPECLTIYPDIENEKPTVECFCRSYTGEAISEMKLARKTSCREIYITING